MGAENNVQSVSSLLFLSARKYLTIESTRREEKKNRRKETGNGDAGGGAFRALAVSSDAHGVVANTNTFRAAFVSSVNDLGRQSIVRALDSARREPHRALAVGAGTVDLDAARRDEVRARVREHAIFQENEIAFDQHVTGFSQAERRPNDLDGREVREIQGTRYVSKLGILDAQALALLREIQLVDAADRHVDHRKVSDRQVGESFLELVDTRVLDPKGLYAVQIDERVARDQRYAPNLGQLQSLHFRRGQKQLEYQSLADVLHDDLLDSVSLGQTGEVKIREAATLDSQAGHVFVVVSLRQEELLVSDASTLDRRLLVNLTLFADVIRGRHQNRPTNHSDYRVHFLPFPSCFPCGCKRARAPATRSPLSFLRSAPLSFLLLTDERSTMRRPRNVNDESPSERARSPRIVAARESGYDVAAEKQYRTKIARSSGLRWTLVSRRFYFE